MFKLLNLRTNDQETIDECENVLVWHIIGDLNNLKIFHSFFFQERMSQEVGLHIQGKGRSSKIQCSRSVHKKEQAWPLPQAFSIPFFLPQNSNSKGKGDYWPLNKRHAKHKLMGSEEKSEGEWDGLSVARQGNGGGPQSGEEIEKDWTPSILGW